MVAGKSFSSRFVSQVKPESQSAAAAAMSKVVRRKKSGLVDDHFQAIIPAVCDKKMAPVHEDSPPPCNCPRHFPKPSQVISNKPSQEIAKGPTVATAASAAAAAASTTSRHRLKTGGDADILGKIDKLLNCRDIIARRVSSPRRGDPTARHLNDFGPNCLGPFNYYVRIFCGFLVPPTLSTLIRKFSVHNVRGNYHFLNHLPTPLFIRNSSMVPSAS
jgi:hypothetical protein